MVKKEKEKVSLKLGVYTYIIVRWNTALVAKDKKTKQVAWIQVIHSTQKNEVIVALGT